MTETTEQPITSPAANRKEYMKLYMRERRKNGRVNTVNRKQVNTKLAEAAGDIRGIMEYEDIQAKLEFLYKALMKTVEPILHLLSADTPELYQDFKTLRHLRTTLREVRSTLRDIREVQDSMTKARTPQMNTQVNVGIYGKRCERCIEETLKILTDEQRVKYRVVHETIDAEFEAVK